MTALLELRNVSKIFGKGRSLTVALDNMTLGVEEDYPHIITIAGDAIELVTHIWSSDERGFAPGPRRSFTR